jgi:hypothetical protein
MWAEWQDENEERFSDYSGSGSKNKAVKLTDILSPFGVTAKDALDYRKFCYRYQPYSGWGKVDASASPNRNNQRLRAEAVEGLLPQPLPDEFLAMHGINVTEVREQEAQMRESMRQDLLSNSSGTVTVGSSFGIIAGLIIALLTLL